MRLAPPDLQRVVDALAAVQSLAEATGTHPHRISAQVVFEDKADLMITAEWDEEVGGCVLVGLEDIEEPDPDQDAYYENLLKQMQAAFGSDFPGSL